jgi:hypothetical protein
MGRRKGRGNTTSAPIDVNGFVDETLADLEESLEVSGVQDEDGLPHDTALKN